jgi:L-lactate dehydrogenase complex protein LldG
MRRDPAVTAREYILNRLRAARSGGEVSDPAAVIAMHARGPLPAAYPDRIARFGERAKRLASTVVSIDEQGGVAPEVARYLDGQGLEKKLVCWPELQSLDWAGVGISTEARAARPDDLVGVTGAFAAIAETGTLMFVSGVATPPATSLMPETHIAVVQASRIVDTMEEAFACLRGERDVMPRAVNFVSGPSRTADVEQTVTLGAHGPYRVHIVIVGA